VNEYKYLGILLPYNMSFRKHLSDKLSAAKNAINATWSRFVVDKRISIDNKLKIFEAAARAILLYGAQVWGFTEYDEVEALLRYYIKRILLLPPNTPNYMLHLETHISPLYLTSLRFHFEYVRKVLCMPETRLPHILVKATFSARAFWVNKWRLLYNAAGVVFPLDICCSQLTNDHTAIIENVSSNHTLRCAESARRSLNHDLYKDLSYSIQPYCFELQSLHMINIFFKARGGLLQLNSNPFIRTATNLCTICNMNAEEDTFHIIGVCPIYRGMRQLYLGKPQLSLDEVITFLNSQNPKPLCGFLTRCLKYRKLILDEFD